MVTGRWKSAAFVEYIREQVAQFSEGVSQRMSLRQNYFAIPAVDTDFLPKEVDPIYTTKTNIGRDAPRHLGFVASVTKVVPSQEDSSDLIKDTTTTIRKMASGSNRSIQIGHTTCYHG
jgi:hypothetical protein